MKTLNASTVLKYAPLIQYLEQERHGFGKFLLVVHGKRPVKIHEIDEECLLKQEKDDVDAVKLL